MSASPRYGIPFVLESQAQANITHNEAILALQVLATGVDDYDINAPPGSPADGDAYIIGSAPTGAWAGRPHSIAYYMAGWRFIPGNDDDDAPITMGVAQEGLKVFVRDENQSRVWAGTGTSPGGYTWVAQGVGPFLPLVGGTLTDGLTINDSTGTNALTIQNPVNGAGAAGMIITGDGVVTSLTQQRFVTSAGGPTMSWRAANGSVAVPAIVSTNKILCTFDWRAHDGVASQTVATEIISVVQTTPAVGALGTRSVLNLAPLGSATPSEVRRWSYDSGLQMYGANTVIDANRLIQNRVYTVATLPTGVQGRQCYASDLRVFNGAGVQEGAGLGTGGTVVYNGTAWKIAGTNVTAVA